MSTTNENSINILSSLLQNLVKLDNKYMTGISAKSDKNKILNYITYTIENNEVTITGCDKTISGAHIIPDIIEGYPVTSIGSGVFHSCSSLTNIVIGNGVTSIGDFAFCNCSSLTSITISNSVTSIGDNAFTACGITSITIPDSVTIMDYSFIACKALTSITILNSVTNINGFNGCSALTSITIPNGATSIDSAAFFECYSLTSITIPDSVTSIGNYAFLDCIALTDVYYEGSKEEWDTIVIDENNEPLLNATIHYNQKLVTKEELKSKLELWQPNTEYKVGDLVVTNVYERETDTMTTKVCYCIQNHTSSNTDTFIMENDGYAWNCFNFYVCFDYKGRPIHETYATKEDLKNLELPNEITGDFTVTNEDGDESVTLSEGKVRGRQGGGIYEIKPDGIDFYGFLGNFSLSTQGVVGNDTAKASWQEWLEVGAGGSGTDLSNYYTKAEVESYVNGAIGQALEGDY